MRVCSEQPAAPQGPLPLDEGHADPLQPEPPGAVDARPAHAGDGRPGAAAAGDPGGAAVAGSQDGGGCADRLRHVRQAVHVPGER